MMKREQRWKKKKEKPCRTENADQLDLLAETKRGERQNGGWHWCRAREYQIDTAVCIVQQSREPGKCDGCGQFRKG